MEEIKPNLAPTTFIGPVKVWERFYCDFGDVVCKELRTIANYSKESKVAVPTDFNYLYLPQFCKHSKGKGIVRLFEIKVL